MLGLHLETHVCDHSSSMKTCRLPAQRRVEDVQKSALQHCTRPERIGTALMEETTKTTGVLLVLDDVASDAEVDQDVCTRDDSSRRSLCNESGQSWRWSRRREVCRWRTMSCGRLARKISDSGSKRWWRRSRVWRWRRQQRTVGDPRISLQVLGVSGNPLSF